MKKSLPFLLILIIGATGCSNDSAGKFSGQTSLITAQLTDNCLQGVSIEKTINDETIVFRFDSCHEAINEKKDLRISLKKEVLYATKYTYENPRIKDDYTIDQTNTEWTTANVLQDKRKKRPLQTQRFRKIKNAHGNEIILESSSTIHQYSWFYDLFLTIDIQFDSSGTYTSHQINQKIKTWPSGKEVETSIKASIIDAP